MKKQKTIRVPNNSVVLVLDKNDKYETQGAIKGTAMLGIFFDLDQWFRGKLKWGHDYKTATEALQAARDNLNEEMRDEGIQEIIGL